MKKPLHRLKSYLAKLHQIYFLNFLLKKFKEKKNPPIVLKDCTLTQVQTSNQQQFKIRNVPNEVPHNK
jgi:hypothetical protein